MRPRRITGKVRPGLEPGLPPYQRSVPPQHLQTDDVLQWAVQDSNLQPLVGRTNALAVELTALASRDVSRRQATIGTGRPGLSLLPPADTPPSFSSRGGS